jgi:hypothetical protein
MMKPLRALVGKARASKLSADARQQIARKAALARHSHTHPESGLPQAVSQGRLTIGDVPIDVYVLKDRRRLIHKRGMARALGLKSEGGNAFMKTISRKDWDPQSALNCVKRSKVPLNSWR